jgi:hypothetical protein
MLLSRLLAKGKEIFPPCELGAAYAPDERPTEAVISVARTSFFMDYSFGDACQVSRQTYRRQSNTLGQYAQ